MIGNINAFIQNSGSKWLEIMFTHTYIFIFCSPTIKHPLSHLCLSLGKFHFCILPSSCADCLFFFFVCVLQMSLAHQRREDYTDIFFFWHWQTLKRAEPVELDNLKSLLCKIALDGKWFLRMKLIYGEKLHDDIALIDRTKIVFWGLYFSRGVCKWFRKLLCSDGFWIKH